MVIASVSFALGVLFCHQLAELPDTLWCSSAPLLLTLVGVSRGTCITVCFVLGVCWTAWVAQTVLTVRLPESKVGTDHTVTAQVLDIPRRWRRAVTFSARIDAVTDRGDWPARSCKVRLAYYGSHLGFAPGERWRLAVRLRQPRDFRNGLRVDREHASLRERLCAVGYLRSSPRPQRLATEQTAGLQRVRAALFDRLGAHMHGLAGAGLVQALTLGLRNGVNATQRQVLRQTGTAHLLAISGLHIGLVAAFGAAFVRVSARLCPWCVVRLPVADSAMVCALLLAFSYAALAGFTLPTQRALIMVFAVALYVWLRRRLSLVGALALALLLVLLRDPFSILGADLWLSFIATGVLGWLFMRPSRVVHRSRWRQAIVQFLAAQCLVSLALWPVTAAVFGVQSWLAPLNNAIAIPITGFIAVPLALIGLVLSGLEFSGAQFVLHAAAHVLGVLMEMLDRLASLEPSWHPPVTHSGMAVAMALAAIALWHRLRFRPISALVPVLLLPLVAPRFASMAPGEIVVEVLDVGQGQAVLVRTAHHTMLYDSGDRSATRIVRDRIRDLGTQSIDLLLVSHGDSDHAGGARQLNQSSLFRHVLSNTELGEYDEHPCHEHQQWNWDGVQFRILHPRLIGTANGVLAEPHGSQRLDANNDSCVLHIEGANGSVLLTGDIEAVAEAALKRRYGVALSSEVLFAPHHGSRSSSSPQFLDAVSPRWVIISSGHRNRFRLPHPQVLARYRDRHYQVYDTACVGRLTIRLYADRKPSIESWWPRGVRFWHSRDRAVHC